MPDERKKVPLCSFNFDPGLVTGVPAGFSKQASSGTMSNRHVMRIGWRHINSNNRDNHLVTSPLEKGVHHTASLLFKLLVPQPAT